jgi:hypothetical protein
MGDPKKIQRVGSGEEIETYRLGLSLLVCEQNNFGVWIIHWVLGSVGFGFGDEFSLNQCSGQIQVLSSGFGFGTQTLHPI